MPTTEQIQTDAEIYAEVYGKLINQVLPAYHNAVDELAKKNYPDVGQFMLNSMAGITATVLRDAIASTAVDTGMPRIKARKKVLKNLNELTNLFVRRLDDAEMKDAIDRGKGRNSI